MSLYWKRNFCAKIKRQKQSVACVILHNCVHVGAPENSSLSACVLHVFVVAETNESLVQNVGCYILARAGTTTPIACKVFSTDYRGLRT